MTTQGHHKECDPRKERMTQHFLQLILATIFVFLPIRVEGETRNWIRRDVPYTGALLLRELGGTDVELSVTGRESTTITVQWKDNTKRVFKTFTDAYGRIQVAEAPAAFGRTMKKENGIRVDGRASEAFLVYTDEPTGLKVYYYDTIGTEQNHYALLIEPPATEPKASAGTAQSAKENHSILDILAALTDPAKLATLDVKTRKIGDRYQKSLYWLHVGSAQQSISARELIRQALAKNNTDTDRTELVIEMVGRSYDHALENDWFTHDNLEEMRNGNCGTTSLGEQIQVDHIVPIAKYPEFANELANLQLMVESENRLKGSKVELEGARLLKKLQLLPPIVPRLPVASAVRGAKVKKNLDFSDPPTPPTWSAIGESLFFQGRLLTERLTMEAAASGLPQDTYVEERAWIEKEKAFGKAQAEEYAALSRLRLAQQPESYRGKIEELRRALLSPK